jgi:hypothetical protein
MRQIKKLGRRCLMLLAASAAWPAVATAQSQWIGGSSNWSNPNNWSPYGVPMMTGYPAIVTSTLGAAQTITYDYSGPTVALSSLDVDLTGGSGGASETLSMSANNLSGGDENVGYSGGANPGTGNGGMGTFNQSGGVNTASGGLALGFNATDTGIYMLGGTGSLMTGPPGGTSDEEVGINGTGIFNQTGGTNTIAGYLFVGGGTGSTGTYMLSGTGAVFDYDNEWVGGNSDGVGTSVSATGIFNQTGGTNTISGNLYLAPTSGETGTYILSGTGTLQAASEIVGQMGTGRFNQSSGTNTITGTVALVIGASYSGSSGSYVLSGTGELSVTGNEYIGDGNPGTFNQSGGTNTISGGYSLNLGGTTSTYILTGGSLTVTGNESVGNTGGAAGVDIFNQTGGINTISPGGELDIGYSIHAAGAYTASGGAATVNGNAYVGGASYGSGGSGTLTVSGTSQMTVTGTLKIYSGSPNVVNLNGGSLSAGTLSYASPFSQLVWTSGTLDLTNQNVTIDSTTAANFGDSASTPSSFVLGVGQTLEVAGAEIVGFNGTGVFNQTGGTSIAGSLVLGNSSGSNGKYTLSSGALMLNGSAYVGGSNSAAGGTGTLTVSNAGQMTITGTLQVYGNGNVNISGTVPSVGGLSISTGGLVNINSALLITSDGGSAATAEKTIQQYIQSSAIISSSINGNTTYGIAYADGSDSGLEDSSLLPGQIVIEPDLNGDADLGGTVTFHDLQILLGDFGNPGFWDQGNFNGHATVDFNDLQLLLGNFNDSTTLGYSELSGIQTLAGEFGYQADPNASGTGFTLVPIPEPASASLLGISTAALLVRRRRRIEHSAPRYSFPTS